MISNQLFIFSLCLFICLLYTAKSYNQNLYMENDYNNGGHNYNEPLAAQFFCTDENVCDQIPVSTVLRAKGARLGKGLEDCRLTCGRYGSLWPKPSGEVLLSSESVPINHYFFHFYHNTNMDDMNRFFEVFDKRWKWWYGHIPHLSTGHQVIIHVNVSNPTKRLDILNTDESYSLRISGLSFCNENPQTWNTQEIYVNISATTLYGARHGLETLSQLMVFDELTNSVRIVCSANIVNDKPVFRYRGMLLDVSRHFYPVETIKRLINAMSYNKFNVLHLHLTDTQSFPVEVQSWPNLTIYGAYGKKQIYTRQNLITLAHYAYLRGITIVPELDAPSHVASGWEWGEEAGLGQLLLCHEIVNSKTCYGPPCGYLNPTNPNVYRILHDVYGELLGHFGTSFEYGENDMFHIGGDEVYRPCWNNSEVIHQWMRDSGIEINDEGFFRVWATFEARAIDALKAANQNHTPWTILWSSTLTEKQRLSTLLYDRKEKLVVEFWGDSKTRDMPDLLDQGFHMIVSNADAWYLDCGGGSWVGEGNNWCSPYKDWRQMYNNRPYRSFNGSWTIDDPVQRKKILGGEGCLWSETISPQNLDIRTWPRAAAIAERLWTDPEHCWTEANARMMAHRERMVFRRIDAEPLQPEWCSRHAEGCVVPEDLYDVLKLRNSCPKNVPHARPSRSPEEMTAEEANEMNDLEQLEFQDDAPRNSVTRPVINRFLMPVVWLIVLCLSIVY